MTDKEKLKKCLEDIGIKFYEDTRNDCISIDTTDNSGDSLEIHFNTDGKVIGVI